MPRPCCPWLPYRPKNSCSCARNSIAATSFVRNTWCRTSGAMLGFIGTILTCSGRSWVFAKSSRRTEEHKSMASLGTIPRRCVNLPPGTLRALGGCLYRRAVQSGPALALFQQRMAQWLGVPYVFGTSMGRAAFQLALESLDLAPGAEIIFPALTFPVLPLIAQQLGYRPIFCAVDAETFNAGPEHIAPQITPRTGAIVATHLFGQPCPIHAVVALAQRHGIRVMEDCAHACGVRVDGHQVGTFGDVGIFSFAEGKNMPCLGGGAIATADDAVARRAEALLAKAPTPATTTILKIALSILSESLLTRPVVFGLTAYPVLRLQLCLG